MSASMASKSSRPIWFPGGDGLTVLATGIDDRMGGSETAVSEISHTAIHNRPQARCYVSLSIFAAVMFLCRLRCYCARWIYCAKPPMGERVAQGWRGVAEPYPELGEGYPASRAR